MKLADLIHKSVSVGVATATPATFATQSTESTGTVARVATVAVANPAQVKTDPAVAAIRRWLDFIGETHQPIIDDVMQMVATDPAALTYYLKRSRETTP